MGPGVGSSRIQFMQLPTHLSSVEPNLAMTPDERIITPTLAKSFHSTLPDHISPLQIHASFKDLQRSNDYTDDPLSQRTRMT